MKKIIELIAVIVFCLLLCACGPSMKEDEVKDNSKYSMFALIEDSSSNGFKVVYHRETKVMYAVSDGHYSNGTFTVLLNPDGTPMLYEGN